MPALHPGTPLTRSRRWRLRLGDFALAAGLLLLLATGILWGLWKTDLTRGDTANYFVDGLRFLAKGHFSDAAVLAYSPLYCAFFGLLHGAFGDAGITTIVHRVVIVAAAGLATLACARVILPRWWAWLVAAWWIALPVNFDAFYEVHLFGQFLAVLACALAGATRSTWGRGLALAVMILNGLLVRNELMLTALLFGAACTFHAWLHRRERPLWLAFAQLAAPVVLLNAAVLAYLFSHPGELRARDFREGLEARGRIALQQIYPLGYLQRNDDWQGNPFRDGRTLMQREFGREDPKFGEALRANPRSLLAHFTWNVRLLPPGLQLGLLNSFSGSAPPDFKVTRSRDVPNPIAATILLALLLALGAWQVLRWRRRHPQLFLAGSPAAWTWLALGSSAATSAVTAILLRPRPSYIFSLNLLIMLFAALSARLLLGELRRRGWLRLSHTRWVPLAIIVALFILLPGSNAARHNTHPLRDDYHRLLPFQATLSKKRRILCTNVAWVVDLSHYLGIRVPFHNGGGPWPAVSKAMEAGTPFIEALTATGATDLYLRLDQLRLPQPPETIAAQLAAAHWQPIAIVHQPGAGWEYWSRELTATEAEQKRVKPEKSSRQE